jgi:hypothetical protein
MVSRDSSAISRPFTARHPVLSPTRSVSRPAVVANTLRVDLFDAPALRDNTATDSDSTGDMVGKSYEEVEGQMSGAVIT